MRKFSLMLLVASLAIVLGLGAVACGSGGTVSGKSPQEAVTAAFEALQTAGSQSGNYEIALTMNVDDSDSDPMMGAFLAQPIQITGSFAEQQDPVRADLSLGLDLMGMSLTAGIRAVDENVWLSVLDQWYEVPAEDVQTVTESLSTDLVASLEQAMDEQGIDPDSWYTDLTLVGEETLDGTKVSHLTATVDIQKIFTDVFALIQSPAFAELMGDAADAASDSDISVPDVSETEDIQAMLDEMIESATLDLWIAADDSLRKVVFATGITISEEMGLTGLSGANVAVTVNLDAPGQTMEVSAPASSKPLSELETDMADNPLLSGLGSLLGLDSGLDGLLPQ